MAGAGGGGGSHARKETSPADLSSCLRLEK